MVSIGAFQALDPSSILGRRKFFYRFNIFIAHAQVSDQPHTDPGVSVSLFICTAF